MRFDAALCAQDCSAHEPYRTLFELAPTWVLLLLRALSLLVELALLLELAWVVLEPVLAWALPLVLALFVLVELALMLELV
jgi:hypothetical protein